MMKAVTIAHDEGAQSRQSGVTQQGFESQVQPAGRPPTPRARAVCSFCRRPRHFVGSESSDQLRLCQL